MRFRSSFPALLSITLCAIGAQAEAQGVPQDGFPNWQERTLWVFVNRDRADPETALASTCTTDCPDIVCYQAPLPPLAYNFDLSRSARFQSQLLAENNVPLMHPSPCRLRPDIGLTYPDFCDGGDACACQTPVQCSNPPDSPACTCGEATTDTTNFEDPFSRIRLFAPGAGTYAENLAAGQADPQDAESSWLNEPCPCCTRNSCAGVECNDDAGTTNGHRANLLSMQINSVGLGAIRAPTVDCVSNGGSGFYWGQDFAYFVTATVQKLVAGSHFPQRGTAITFYANWFDPEGGAPSKASVIVNGRSETMTVDRGSEGNATYAFAGTVPSGSCETYTFEFTDSAGTRVVLPVSGAYLVGDNCTRDFAVGGGCASGGGDPWFGVILLALAGLRPRRPGLGSRKLTNRQ